MVHEAVLKVSRNEKILVGINVISLVQNTELHCHNRGCSKIRDASQSIKIVVISAICG